ncbi:hypothetical protein QTO34_010628 [Cnephaeus nilssonii]|uniref:SH3 domain-containing protein n=1 Tax=Cnephaeus nilssonii TaxID=3371016 RepID=A0AA40HFX1_CNENI|nr:hypothetical protein QTO34_010628 [Eptesicus nilssonii]
MGDGQAAEPSMHILMPTCVLSPQNVLAKALYDNVAESPDELSFRKGDIMTVLERDTQGLDGWWLCSLHGRQGIVPGNRLKILVGMHDKKPAGPGPGPPAPLTPPQPGLHNPAAQYTPMLPVTYPPQSDSIYLVPTPSKTQQGLYQAPGPSPQFQSPPAKQTSTFSKQMPHHPFPSPAPDLYQVPPGPGNSTQDIYQVPPSAGMGLDIYQVPPSMDARSWEGTKPPPKGSCLVSSNQHGYILLPFSVGASFPAPAPQLSQPRAGLPWLCPPPWGPQDIYDVPPVRGLPSQYGQEVYDTPPMAVKGPNGWDPSLDVYDVPPSVEKSLPPSSHAVSSRDLPSSSKDVPDGPLLREETYDVPPAFAKAKPFDPTRHPLVLAAPPPDSSPAEDVYDVPPPAPDIYDVPPGLRRPGPSTLYDVPRERVLPPEVADSSAADDGVYVVPPSAEREAPADAKRLSASSTGSTRSSQSASSLEAPVPGREPLELEVAVEALTRLQQGVSATVTHLLDVASSAGRCGGWRSTTEPQEPPAQDLRAAVAAVQGAVHELLEFARSAVGNSAHTSDRTLNAKLSRQLQKMEDVYQTLVAHGQTFDSSRGGPGATSEDLDRLVACSRAVPEDAKQLASFLHGNASLLFRRTKAPMGSTRTVRVAGWKITTMSTCRVTIQKQSSTQTRVMSLPPKIFVAHSNGSPQVAWPRGPWMEDGEVNELQVKHEFGNHQLFRELPPRGNEVSWLFFVPLHSASSPGPALGGALWQQPDRGKPQPSLSRCGQGLRRHQTLSDPISHRCTNPTPLPPPVSFRPKVLGESARQVCLFKLLISEAHTELMVSAYDIGVTNDASHAWPGEPVSFQSMVNLTSHVVVFKNPKGSRKGMEAGARSGLSRGSCLLTQLIFHLVHCTKEIILQPGYHSLAKMLSDRLSESEESTHGFQILLGRTAGS